MATNELGGTTPLGDTQNKSRWVVTTWKQRATAPDLPGVYVVFDQEHKPFYVGQSVSLRQRLRSHSLIVPSSLRLKYRVCKKVGEWLALEYKLIARLRPPRNHTHGASYLSLAGQTKVQSLIEGTWQIRSDGKRRMTDKGKANRRAKAKRRDELVRQYWAKERAEGRIRRGH